MIILIIINGHNYMTGEKTR